MDFIEVVYFKLFIFILIVFLTYWIHSIYGLLETFLFYFILVLPLLYYFGLLGSMILFFICFLIFLLIIQSLCPSCVVCCLGLERSRSNVNLNSDAHEPLYNHYNSRAQTQSSNNNYHPNKPCTSKTSYYHQDNQSSNDNYHSSKPSTSKASSNNVDINVTIHHNLPTRIPPDSVQVNYYDSNTEEFCYSGRPIKSKIYFNSSTQNHSKPSRQFDRRFTNTNSNNYQGRVTRDRSFIPGTSSGSSNFQNNRSHSSYRHNQNYKSSTRTNGHNQIITIPPKEFKPCDIVKTFNFNERGAVPKTSAGVHNKYSKPGAKRKQPRRQRPARTKCPICLEYMNSNQKLVCGHSVHLGCINKWFQTGKRTCPVCRKECINELITEQ